MSTDIRRDESGDVRGFGLDGDLSDALVRSRRFFTKAEASDDLRTMHKSGGREADTL